MIRYPNKIIIVVFVALLTITSDFIYSYDFKKKDHNLESSYQMENKNEILPFIYANKINTQNVIEKNIRTFGNKHNENENFLFSINNDHWREVENVSSLDGFGVVNANSFERLSKVACFYTDLGLVHLSNNKSIPYTCSKSKRWELGGTYKGRYTILDLSRNFSAQTGSTVNIEIPHVGSMLFIKKDRYWKDSSNTYVIAENLKNIQNLNRDNINYAYILNNASSYYSLKKVTISYISKWAYLANGYDDVVLNFDEIDRFDGGYVYDQKNSVLFQKKNNVWVSLDETIQLSSNALGRDVFENIKDGRLYYLLFSDCTISTCVGEKEQEYYSGEKHDGMKVYSYSNVQKSKNGLADAVPQISFKEMYKNKLNLVYFKNKSYAKIYDNHNNICYTRVNSVVAASFRDSYPLYFVKNEEETLPSSISCETRIFNSNSV